MNRKLYGNIHAFVEKFFPDATPEFKEAYRKKLKVILTPVSKKSPNSIDK